MKLITEHLDSDIGYITEGVGAEKKTFVEGVFMQAEKPNRNGRIYRYKVLAPAVAKYITEQVDKVSHRITSLKWDGHNVMGKALILNTPMGNIVKGLVEGGVRLGVSSRGMGSLERSGNVMTVKSDFVLSTIDIVQDPSAPEAFVNGIMEGVEYFVRGNEIIAERIQAEIHRTPSKQLIEAQVRVFKNFLNEIASR